MLQKVVESTLKKPPTLKWSKCEGQISKCTLDSDAGFHPEKFQDLDRPK